MTSCSGCGEHMKSVVAVKDRLRRSRITHFDTVEVLIAYGYETVPVPAV